MELDAEFVCGRAGVTRTDGRVEVTVVVQAPDRSGSEPQRLDPVSV